MEGDCAVENFSQQCDSLPVVDVSFVNQDPWQEKISDLIREGSDSVVGFLEEKWYKCFIRRQRQF